MTVALIVAVAENGVIGRDNRMPWHIPEDLRYFKRMTLGKPVIMGRKMFDSIGKPLPGRTNLVVTRNPDWRAAGTEAFLSLDAALDAAPAHVGSSPEIMVIGGGQIYALALARAQRLYLTEIHRAYAGDVLFPPVDRTQWTEITRDDRAGVAADREPDYSWVVLER